MFRRITSLLSDFFRLPQPEGRGLLVLIGLISLTLLGSLLYKHLARPAPTDTLYTDQRTLDSLLALMKTDAARQPHYRRGDDADRVADERSGGTPRRSAERFAFDPNTISVADWQRLGLPRWLAERIDKYRSKGGQFRRPEDLQRIYSFPPDLYRELAPYITLPERRPGQERYAGANTRYPDRTPGPSGEPRGADRPRYVKPVLQPFDINTADTAQLVALKGIGSALAGRIVKYRDALGGFVSPAQFATIYGLDSLALGELTHYAQVRSAPRRIPINTASAADLDRHPFISRRQAELIVRYREQHGAYTSIESLRPIRMLDAATLEKISPYLTF